MPDKNRIWRNDYLKLFGIEARGYRNIAIVGGGGKTSLIYKLAKEFLSQKEKVIITTTTHMAFEPDRPFALDGNPEKIKECLDKYGYVIAAGYEAETDKFASLSEEGLLSLKDYGAVILIEADGAKKKPVKVPEKWEPVIPDFAEMVIGVIGLDCLFKPIKEAAHRPEKTAEFLGKSLDDELLPSDIVKIAASSEGLRKSVENRVYYVYLNKADALTKTTTTTSMSSSLNKADMPIQTEIAAEILSELKKRNIEASYGSLKETK